MKNKTKHISILGSTGSIGTQALQIVRANKDLKVSAMAAGSNISLLEEQIREFRPRLACVWDEKKAAQLKENIKDLNVRVESGMEGLLAAAECKEADIVLTAVVGMIGIEPTIAAIRAGKDIALANKETLVAAGHIIMPLAKKTGVKILPVDSEHSAIFQCLLGEESRPEKILLTASGGPFRGYTAEMLKKVTLEDALKHPNWSMGKKITIDSSTMVNKALEVIEAHWLFDLPIDSVEPIIQPQSIIHSMVEFEDGAVKAQLGTPDMKIPIQFALLFPQRRNIPGKRLDFAELKSIAFEKPDMEVFSGLRLGIEAGRAGGLAPAVFNAANEYAVGKFLSGQISYTDITAMISMAMSHFPKVADPGIKRILKTRKEVETYLSENWEKA